MIQEVLEKGVKVDGSEAIQSLLETIISMVILSRCTDNSDIFDADAAKEKLEKVVGQFNDTQQKAVALLFELEELDRYTLRLHENSYYFDDACAPREDLMQCFDDLEYCIAEIEKTKEDKSQLSVLFTDASDVFRCSLLSLKEAASDSCVQYAQSCFQKLCELSQELKLATLHAIVTDIKIELDRLAKGELNDHIFYKSSPKVKGVRPNPGPRGHFEDRVDGLRKAGDMNAFLEQLGSLTNLYLSSYVPEFGEENQKHVSL